MLKGIPNKNFSSTTMFDSSILGSSSNQYIPLFISTWENSRLLEWLFGTLQKLCPELGRVESTVWYFCARFSDVISRENQWRRHVISAVFSGHFFTFSPVKNVAVDYSQLLSAGLYVVQIIYSSSDFNTIFKTISLSLRSNILSSI